MDTEDVPVALRDRLGPEATVGLVELFVRARDEWREEVVNFAAERFERPLVQETSSLRVEMAREFAGVRQEMAQGFAALRQEVAQGLASVRQDMAQGLASVREDSAREFAVVRQEMAQGFAALRVEFREQSVGLYKWSFLFWVGQVAVMAALLAFMLRR